MGRLIDADRLKEIFSRNVVGGNAFFDLIDNAPTIEAIPKAEYEARLKADMIAMLEELDLQIDESAAYNREYAKVQRLIRDKIDTLKDSKEAEFHCGVEESGFHAYNCNDCPNKCEEWYQWDKEMKNGIKKEI